ncbi:MAG: hypothetical protein GY751_19055 [Bacteroidetes bacterium]|nr:hypothetical protein [Bacteroidota bacterium]MCP4800456.1 hypothetical protein [bacterium]
MKTVICVIAMMLLVNVCFAEVTIPPNTVIPVRSTEPIDAKYIQAGQEIILVVASNVRINQETVIKAGAPVVAFVNDSSSSQMAGISGKISLAMRSTVAVDGSIVPLSGTMMNSGESEVGSTVAVGVILCPLALLNKGEAGRIPPGMEIRAMTVGQTVVDTENQIEIDYRTTEYEPDKSPKEKTDDIR